MKVTTVIDTRRKKVNGKFPVKIRFYAKKNVYYVGTGIDVNIEHFNASEGIITGTSKASVFNQIIFEKTERLLNVLKTAKEESLFNTKTAKEIQRIINDAVNHNEDITIGSNQFLNIKTYLNNFISKYTEKRTIETYKNTLAKIDKFCGTDFLITDINVSWIKDFEIFCYKEGMTANGISIYLRCIRALINDAIDREYMGYDAYPFRRFKIKKAVTRHRNLSLDEIRKIIFFDYEKFYADLRKKKKKKNTSRFPEVKKYADLFLLSFYLCGMNIKDIIFLRKEDIRNNTVYTQRSKTNESVVIFLEPEALEIINRYPGKKYLLSYLDNYSTDDYRNVERLMNKNIKFILSHLSSYWARHTWATFAAEVDVSDAVIDLAQGRKSAGMTAVYVNRNQKKVSEANRKVIDYVNNLS